MDGREESSALPLPPDLPSLAQSCCLQPLPASVHPGPCLPWNLPPLPHAPLPSCLIMPALLAPSPSPAYHSCCLHFCLPLLLPLLPAHLLTCHSSTHHYLSSTSLALACCSIWHVPTPTHAWPGSRGYNSSSSGPSPRAGTTVSIATTTVWSGEDQSNHVLCALGQSGAGAEMKPETQRISRLGVRKWQEVGA